MLTRSFRKHRRGQANGLLGAAVPGVLSFVTGLHTGAVPLQILWHDHAPAEPGAEYLDVVEASFQPQQAELLLWTFHEHYFRHSPSGDEPESQVQRCWNG